ncbi:hypothetical protein ACEW7V_02055 [Areca yellow leaf disease phytoplasma]|uniref:hypothetical protein n=1 Tax=Areca yellow leaf disease phytoplasma TaxID=927614 RepID=UPI0035B56DC1
MDEKPTKKIHIFRDKKLQETLEKIQETLGIELLRIIKEKQKQFNPTFVEPKSNKIPMKTTPKTKTTQ